MHGPLHDVAIVGAYHTEQARKLAVPEPALLLDAIRGGLASAGIGAADVDGVNASAWVSGVRAREAVQWLGGRPCWTGTGSAGIEAVLEAASAIAAGLCETVLVAAAQAGEYGDHGATVSWTRPSNEFVECWGLYTAAEFALIAQRHMHVYGTTQESLAEVAAAIRTNGARNPEAVMYGREVTTDDVLDSRMVASPFHLLDCCITSEGGASLVLTTRERARDLDVEPVFLLGGGMDRQGMSYTSPPVFDLHGRVGERAGRRAFAQAGLTPADVDVAELYDPFSFEVIRQLEAMGFCGYGEGGDFVMDGRIRTGGELPVATNGGLLSYSHAGLAQMLQKVTNGVRQLRGELPDELTVPDARVVLATNGGAGALFCDALLLGRDPA